MFNFSLANPEIEEQSKEVGVHNNNIVAIDFNRLVKFTDIVGRSYLLEKNSKNINGYGFLQISEEDVILGTWENGEIVGTYLIVPEEDHLPKSGYNSSKYGLMTFSELHSDWIKYTTSVADMITSLKTEYFTLKGNYKYQKHNQSYFANSISWNSNETNWTLNSYDKLLDAEYEIQEKHKTQEKYSCALDFLDTYVDPVNCKNGLSIIPNAISIENLNVYYFSIGQAINNDGSLYGETVQMFTHYYSPMTFEHSVYHPTIDDYKIRVISDNKESLTVIMNNMIKAHDYSIMIEDYRSQINNLLRDSKKIN